MTDWAVAILTIIARARFAAKHGQIPAACMHSLRRRPYVAIIATAALAVTLSCYPVVFFGKSFVSPNNGGTWQLYPQSPFVPGDHDLTTEDVRSSDVGAVMWHTALTQFSNIVRCSKIGSFHSGIASAIPAGVTDRLWEIGDIVDVLEAWENR